MKNNPYSSISIGIVPDSKQKDQIEKNIKGYNFVWNTCIEENIRRYKEREIGKSVGTMTYQSQFEKYIKTVKEKNEWLVECDSRALQGATKELEIAYENIDFWNNFKHPDMKTEKDTSYIIYFSKSNSGPGSDPVTLEWESFSLPAIGKLKLPKVHKVKCTYKIPYKINRNTLKRIVISHNKNLYQATLNVKN